MNTGLPYASAMSRVKVSRSLLMANTQATLRGQTLINASPRLCMERSNKLLYDQHRVRRSLSQCSTVSSISPRHQLIYSNAGHDIPYLLSTAASVIRLKTGGVR